MKSEITDPHAKLTCRVVRAANQFTGKQALLYAPGISAEAAGAQGIHRQILTIPPLGRAKAHKHDSHETAIYALSGESRRLQHTFRFLIRVSRCRCRFRSFLLSKLTARRCIFPQPQGGDPVPIDGQLAQSDCDCGT